MKSEALRLLIRAKLADGRLPHKAEPHVWGVLGTGEICEGCDDFITKDQFAIQAIALDEPRRALQLHTACFHAWKSEGRAHTPGSA